MSVFGRGRWRRREVTLTDQLGRYLEGWQRKLADRLNLRFGSWPRARLRLWLVVSCVPVAIYLLWVIVDAFG
jgi:hypothetical protein